MREKKKEGRKGRRKQNKILRVATDFFASSGKESVELSFQHMWQSRRRTLVEVCEIRFRILQCTYNVLAVKINVEIKKR